MKKIIFLLAILALSASAAFSQGFEWGAKAGKDNYYDRDALNKFDVSAAMGLSYKICGRFDVSARYNLGLTRIQDDYEIDNMEFKDKARNSVISVGVGYRF